MKTGISKNNGRTKNALALLLSALIVVIVFAFAFLNKGVKAAAKTAVSDVFVTRNVELSEGNEESGRAGLKMVGLADGASAKIVDKVSGVFTTELGFGQSALSEVTLAFKSAQTDEAFTITVENAESGFNVYAEAFGKKAGIYYPVNETTLTSEEMNAQGVYTQVSGEFVELTFDPNSLQVLANGKTVWDFSIAVNDWADIGGTFSPITCYEVEFLFRNADREAGVYIYELLDEKFDTPILINGNGPAIFADVAKNGVLGKSYAIPDGYAYDLIDGQISKLYVSVEKVEAYSETTVLEKTELTTGLSFTPTLSGTYRITYYATDSDGVEGVKAYSLKADNFTQELVFENDQASFPETLGVGSRIVLPLVSVRDSLYQNESRLGLTLLTIRRDGTAIDGYQTVKVKNNQEFVFENAGKYELIYSLADGGEQTYSIAFTVSETLPAVAFPFVSARYAVGEAFAFGDVETEYNGEKKNATRLLIYPSELAKTGETAYLSEYGLYALTYKTQFASRTYAFTRTFETADEIVRVESLAERKVVYTASAYTQECGVGFALEENEALVYNGIIDLTTKTASDSLIELYFTPQTLGVLETDMLDITLTDVYDENNFITVRSYSTASMTSNYVTAGVKNNRKVGWNNGELKTWANVGTPGYASHAGNTEDGKRYPLSFSFDYAKGEIYLLRSDLSTRTLVTNLRNAAEHDEVFQGFTTGEAYLKITAHSLTKPRASFLLRSIDGKTLTDTYTFKYPDAEILVDVFGYEENELPTAQVGKAYEIFPATCREKNGKALNVTTRVYYHYGKVDQTDIDLVNGAFKPLYEGEYTIAYTAVTSCGKAVQKLLHVQAREEATPVRVYIDPPNTATKVGVKTAINQATVEGGTGKTSVIVTYRAPSGATGAVDSYLFTPLEKGEYALTYVVSDYLGKAYEETVALTVEENLKPQFETESVSFPAFFITGKTYALPKLTAMDYSSGVKQAQVSLLITEGEQTQENPEFSYTPNLTGGGSVKLTYKAHGDKDTNEIVYEIPVKNIRSMNEFFEPEYDLTQYFIGSEIQVSVDEQQLYIDSTGANASCEYIYPLLAEGFSFKFNLEPENNNVRGVSVWFIDAENKDIAFKLTYSKKSATDSTSDISVNDGLTSGTANGSLYGTTGDFVLKYENQKKVISDSLSYSFVINKTADGKDFNGFPSGKLRLRVEFDGEGETGGTRFICKEINYQLFTANKLDEVAPQILVEGSENKYVEINTVAKTPTAIAMDVLEEELTFTVSGSCNGKYLKSVDGVTLNNAPVKAYEVQFDEIGMYTFTYTATDRMGNTARAYTTLTVLDTVAPVISVSSKTVTAQVGKEVELPKASATDNLAGEMKVYAVIIRPDLVIDGSTDGKYTPVMDGTHTIRYICVDESGNVARVTVQMQVKKGR